MKRLFAMFEAPFFLASFLFNSDSDSEGTPNLAPSCHHSITRQHRATTEGKERWLKDMEERSNHKKGRIDPAGAA
ncbi:hypothetical protein F4777DRAFT_538651 [Nemania sp. FL0916]|nr:hypothetical protein F4777DRAFT_538651 [Nemania sp. FL0916]